MATTVNPTAQSGGSVSVPTTPTSIPQSPGPLTPQQFTGAINLTIANGREILNVIDIA